jgi:DNA-binding CsgD family transcriptional regulator/pimeloyl-ACP methyl ester carboxylesterase
MKSLEGYSVFLERLQSAVTDAHVGDTFDTSRFADFEEYASYALQAFLETSVEDPDTRSSVMLAKHDCAALTVTNDGTIRQANLQACDDLGVMIDKTLAHCGIGSAGDESLAEVLAYATEDHASPFHIVQLRVAATKSVFTAALSQIQQVDKAEPIFLILFIRPPDASKATQILANKFGLTLSETDIVKAFLDGMGLRDIAAQRSRSYTTIRNQFQSVLDKSGCVSQTALFRLSYSLLQLVDQATGLADQPKPTRLRTVTLPRPKGRVVELVLCGDDAGQPILSLPSLFGHGITPKIEAELRARGILLISVMRPGLGGTSSALAGEAVVDCLAGDVAAILNSLEITSCPLIARASAARSFYGVLLRLPERITRGVIVNGLIPRDYIAGKSVKSRWTTALMSVSTLSHPIAKLILGTGNRLLMNSEGGSFLQKMYQGSASDHSVLGDPDVVASIKAGVKEVTKQGLSAGVEDIVDGFQNWSSDLAELSHNVTVYHGQHDPNVPIAGVEEFTQRHADRLTLITEDEGGGQLSYSHFSRVLDLSFSSENSAFHL